jgi:hypothetical protein
MAILVLAALPGLAAVTWSPRRAARDGLAGRHRVAVRPLKREGDDERYDAVVPA